ncbi:alpha/beta fold hydrolase [Indioceanicola profundi]|uniref:alpha/beta fold hydrolase n=1 Tax=Indioceanicola profundi TaxID=2220096 RepID=UPI000E6AAEBE|nr:alpha/beta fold hydrolase [Indioceanicola profundi]
MPHRRSPASSLTEKRIPAGRPRSAWFSGPAALLLLLLAAGCSSAPDRARVPDIAAEPPAYDYPIDNPWLATIIRTPPEQRAILPEPEETERRTISIFPDRQVPEGFWYYRGLNYTAMTQPGPAPLAFVIAGTGADDRAGVAATLGRALYAAGMHVALLPSPTHPNFIVTASATSLPGRATQDAADLLRAMRAVEEDLGKDGVGITGFHLTGYSLGGWHAAFVAMLDGQDPHFRFGRVLLLNPPISLYSSIRTIDRMLTERLPHGVDDLTTYLDQATERVSSVLRTTDALEFDGANPALTLYEQIDPDDDDLAAAIGLSFRLSSANLIFTADVMSNSGYIFPRNRPFLSTTPLQDYFAVSIRTSFLDYFRDIYSEFYGRGPDPDREALIRQASLTSIAGFLTDAGHVAAFTNRDDVILAPGDLQELQRLFGSRLHVYPNGGHLGNVEHRAVVADIVNFFKG